MGHLAPYHRLNYKGWFSLGAFPRSQVPQTAAEVTTLWPRAERAGKDLSGTRQGFHFSAPVNQPKKKVPMAGYLQKIPSFSFPLGKLNLIISSLQTSTQGAHFELAFPKVGSLQHPAPPIRASKGRRARNLQPIKLISTPNTQTMQ